MHRMGMAPLRQKLERRELLQATRGEAFELLKGIEKDGDGFWL